MTIKQNEIDALKSKLDEWDAKIDRLEAQGREAKAQANSEFHKRLAKAKSKREEAANYLSQLRDAQSDAWEVTLEGAKEVWGNMKQTIHEATEAFQEGMKKGR